VRDYSIPVLATSKPLEKMSLQYTFDNMGGGRVWSQYARYAQTVELPSGLIRCSGQGGWEANGETDPTDVRKQIDNAIQNVDRVLRDAGSRGWEDVFSLRSFHTDIDNSFDHLLDGLKARLPSPTYTWTAVQVARLSPNMLIELEVEAWKGKMQ
jgi:enamine deaminase RidA (YjgF/YER057c/UK114 family)